MWNRHILYTYTDKFSHCNHKGGFAGIVPILSTPILSTPISSTPVLLLVAEVLYMDETFQIAPRLFYQVLTIHVFKHGQRFVVLPSSYVAGVLSR